MIKSSSERKNILIKESGKTLDDFKLKLSSTGRCICVRPTGFGKTYTLIQLLMFYANKYPNKKVVYIYPSKIILNEIMNNSEYDWEFISRHTVFISYQALALVAGISGSVASRLIYIEEIANSSICLLDEVHRAAAEGFRQFYSYIEEYLTVDNVHLAGVTATPYRQSEEESEWIFNDLFKGVSTYEYTLLDAIESGLLLKPIYSMAKFQVMEITDEYRKEIKKAHIEANGYFNEHDFETSFNKIYNSNGTEAEIIYRNLKRAGYNLALDSPDNSYIKFIVFFSNVADLVENGEQTENWFFDAIELGLKKEDVNGVEFTKHVDYVVSVTADAESDYVVAKHVSKQGSLRSLIYNATMVGENDQYIGHHIDLVFNVNILTMGYHVSNLTGIMMRRGAGTDIMYYQQLGRCFSVKASKPSIVFDLACNKDMQRNRDIRKAMLSGLGVIGGSEGTYGNKGEGKEHQLEDAFVLDFEEGLDDLFDKWRDPNYSYISRVRYLYLDRNMPIALIAQDTGLTCVKVAQYLVQSGVKIKFETPMYEFLGIDENCVNMHSNSFRFLRLLYSKKAYSLYARIKSSSGKKLASLFTFLAKFLGGTK